MIHNVDVPRTEHLPFDCHQFCTSDDISLSEGRDYGLYANSTFRNNRNHDRDPLLNPHILPMRITVNEVLKESRGRSRKGKH